MGRPFAERAGLDPPAPTDAAGIDVFLSHVEEDRDVALELADALGAAGYSTWCYERDTVPGPSYLLQTSRAIEASRAVVVLISPDSLGSHQVTSEVVRAHEEVKPFIPLLVGISHAEFGARQPEWREAVGSAATLDVPDGKVASVVPKIVDGLTALGIEPHPGGPPPKRLSFAPITMPGPAPGRSRRLLVVGLAIATILLIGVVTAVFALRDQDAPGGGANTGTPSATSSSIPSTAPTAEPTAPGTEPDAIRNAARTPLVTGKGEARVTARLVSDFCNLAGDCRTAPAGRRFLLLDVTAWGSGDLSFDPDLSMESFGTYVTFEGERAGTNETMLLEGPPSGMTVVYTTLPAAAAGGEVILYWRDNPPLRVRVTG